MLENNFHECFIEIMSEKMPTKAVLTDPKNLQTVIYEFLSQYIHDIKALVTISPYRICIQLKTVYDILKTHPKRVKGPKVGTPQDVVRKFADKYGEITTAEEDDHYWLTVNSQEYEFTSILPDLFNYIIENTQWHEWMRWGFESAWIRPIRRVVVVFKGKPVIWNIEKFNLKTSPDSLYYFNSDDSFYFDSAQTYISKLKSNSIMIDNYEREQYLTAQIQGFLTLDQNILQSSNLKEISNSFESIFIYKGEYANQYSLPKEVILSAMAEQEGYIPIFSNDKLSNQFFAISEYEMKDDGRMFIAGCSRGIENRIQEMYKIWSQDVSTSYENYVTKQKMHLIGDSSLWDQSNRLVEISKTLFPNNDLMHEAFRYVNIGLTMNTTFEVPALHNFMSAQYATSICNLNSEAADFLYSLYNPTTEQMKSFTFLYKLDRIVSLFPKNPPKGSSDPLGIRRDTFTMLKLGLSISGLPPLSSLIDHLTKDNNQSIIDFCISKYLSILEDEKYSTIFVLSDIDWNEKRRIQDFNKNHTYAEYENAGQIYKRMVGILKNQPKELADSGHSKSFSTLDVLCKKPVNSFRDILTLMSEVATVLNDEIQIKDLNKESRDSVINKLIKVEQLVNAYCIMGRDIVD